MNRSPIQPNILVRTTMSIDQSQRIDHSASDNDCNSDDVASFKTDKKRAVSFAPSCQVIRFSDEDGPAYLCHEAMKESSTCIDGELGQPPELDESTSSGKKKQQAVRFDSSSPVIHLIDSYTEDRAEELWYSRYDYMIFEGEACECSHFIQDIESQGLTFHGDLGHILGLEKIILWERYLDKRDALRQTILNEQAVQRLAKNIRTNQGSGSDEDERTAKDMALLHLAKTSARLSRWARDCASIAALTLEHDLALSRAIERSVE